MHECKSGLNVILTARKKGSESEEYTQEAMSGLEILCRETEEAGNTKKVGSDLSRTLLLRVTNTLAQSWSGVIKIEVGKRCRNPRFFIPGFMYGRNTGELPNSGRKEFPRIREGSNRRPESEAWMVRSDRPAAPVSMVYDGGEIFGISASPYLVIKDGCKQQTVLKDEALKRGEFYQYCGFTCSLHTTAMEDQCTVGYTLGYENAPWLFVQTATVIERAKLSEANCITLKEGETIECEVTVFEYTSENETGIYDALREIYEKMHQMPRKLEGMTVKKAVKYLAEATAEAAWLAEDQLYAGFVFDRQSGYEYNKLGSLSWTNGLAVAVPMLLAGLRLKNTRVHKQALECIGYITKTCMNSRSGLPYDAVDHGKWSNRGWWYDGMHTPGHSSYLCGQALYYLLKAYEYEKKLAGTEHREWIDFVKPIIVQVNSTVSAQKEYPFVLSEETGAGLEYLSFGSCWCLTATVYYALLTDDHTYLKTAMECEEHYYQKYVSRVECYGGPLDTDKAVDSEGILAYIRAVRKLHELTGEDKYLKHLKDAIYYESTFKLCYNTPVQIPPLSTIGWSSCGGSITSTANPHIHPMSNTITDEMLYYVEQTGDTYVKSRWMDTIGWGLQTFNTYDGEYGYGKIGWMSERFCFCQGLLVEKYPDGSPASTWFALMPWAVASILEGYTGECWDKILK